MNICISSLFCSIKVYCYSDMVVLPLTSTYKTIELFYRSVVLSLTLSSLLIWCSILNCICDCESYFFQFLYFKTFLFYLNRTYLFYNRIGCFILNCICESESDFFQFLYFKTSCLLFYLNRTYLFCNRSILRWFLGLKVVIM